MQDPKQLLEQLSEGADPRKTRSLELIYKLCVEQHEHNSNDYSIKTIGRLSAERGGPAARAIRNPTGEAYRILIQAYADSVGALRKKPAVPKNDDDEPMLRGVSDPMVRTRFNLMLAEIKSLRGQLSAARHLANQQAVVQIVSGETPPAVSPVSEEKLELTATELRSLTRAIGEETLKHWGWKEDASGRIVTDTDQPVFGPGYASAIRKVIEFQKAGVMNVI